MSVQSRLIPIQQVEDDGFRLKYIITGTGYCGTTYVAQLLCSVGIPCGQEHYFDPTGVQSQEMLKTHETKTHLPWTGNKVPSSEGVADSSCHAVRHLDHPMCQEAALIHLVRDPVLIFRTHLSSHANIDYACNWWVDTNAIIEKHRNELRYHRVRIDDCPHALLEIVGKADATDYFRPELIEDATKRARAYNSKWYRVEGREELTWGDLPDSPAVDRMRRMAKRYGVGPRKSGNAFTDKVSSPLAHR